MAKQVIYELVDDIDGTAIAEGEGESIEFTLDGVDYVIDLKTKNANDFRKKIEYYVDHATRIGGRKRKVTTAGTATKSTPKTQAITKRDPAQTRAIRQWAADSGYDVNDRGRIPAGIVEAYEAEHAS
ncbi:Lsr2 family protein [Rhodococcus sp. G-MC3]|uniref:histone-like nucleoid-structuring protein Lsr2 n=1 Tax=Rhodococcus sp. G-MC3 TaxID=3046209 RepID=UPI0024B8B0E0|nr:Lsr2 family protein [Rhodococcus sp. G-MC3]MDJ0395646.1 Lsr2 family protein [Rhodococcus sp. G-MC3]